MTRRNGLGEINCEKKSYILRIHILGEKTKKKMRNIDVIPTVCVSTAAIDKPVPSEIIIVVY